MKPKLKEIEFDFKQQIIEQEKDAIIESMLEEIEILELRHRSRVMQREKKLKALGIKGVGDTFYDRYQIAYMKVETGEENRFESTLKEIQSLICTTPCPLNVKLGGCNTDHLVRTRSLTKLKKFSLEK